MYAKLRTRFPVLLATSVVAFFMAAPATWADDDDDDDDDETIPFEEAEVFFELNNTDGDLGIHSAVDGGPWKKLEMEGPNGRDLLKIKARGRLRRQGLTQLFFESAEPTFDELDPAVFFARYPEGEYEIEGVTLDGEELESTTELTHLMPAPPDPTVNGLTYDKDCEDDVVVEVTPPIEIVWPAVNSCHPTLGTPCGMGEIEIHNYEVVVEADIEIAPGEEVFVKTSTILPPGEMSYVVPDAFIALSDEWKFEILAREESFNQTAIESCFVIE